MNCLLRCLMLKLIFVSGNSFAGAGEYTLRPEYTVTAPGGSFVIEQRALVEADEWAWQAWICPGPGAGNSYQLPLWHERELCWPGDFTVAPDGKTILHIQKTGSGSNEGALFRRRGNGRFELNEADAPGSKLLERAWAFFRKWLGRDPMLTRGGMAFVSWGADGECVELSLRGEDPGGGIVVTDWRVHYNFLSGRYFLTRDQRLHNRGAVTSFREKRTAVKPAGK